MDHIWWSQITMPSFFVSNIAESISEESDIILQMPASIPWYDTFLYEIETKVKGTGLQKELVLYSYDELDPGEWLSKEFCREELRDRRPVGVPYSEFLASQEEIVLHERIIWVQNLTEMGLAEWLTFIRDFRKHLPTDTSSAVFVLEFRGELGHFAKGKAKRIIYNSEISDYDKYTFCTLICSQSSTDSSLKHYLAELVSKICSDDVELCAACVGRGISFAQDPELCLKEIAESELRSDGSSFMIEEVLDGLPERLWEGQLRSVFPLLERFRAGFVKEHWRDINAILPRTNSFGETIWKPEEAELGDLYRFTSEGSIQMHSNDEYPRLRRFKDMRDSLAHLNSVPFEDVMYLLNHFA